MTVGMTTWRTLPLWWPDGWTFWLALRGPAVNDDAVRR